MRLSMPLQIGTLSACTHCFMIMRFKPQRRTRCENSQGSCILKSQMLRLCSYGTSLTARLRVTSQLLSTSAQKGGGGMPSAADATPHPLNSHGYARHAKRTAIGLVARPPSTMVSPPAPSVVVGARRQPAKLVSLAPHSSRRACPSAVVSEGGVQTSNGVVPVQLVISCAFEMFIGSSARPFAPVSVKASVTLTAPSGAVEARADSKTGCTCS